MAFPTLVINSAGSNTLASGAGPSTALTGTLAATNTNTTVNITDAVNLAGVAVDGSAVLWIATASGRQWSAITTISGTSGNWTVTVITAYGGTATGQSWAIGGKRATIAGSLKLFVNGVSNGDADIGDWSIDIQTGESFSAALTPKFTTVKRGHPVTIFSSVGSAAAGTGPVITTATNSINLFDLNGSTGLIVRNLKFTNTAGTKGTTSSNGRCFLSAPSGAQDNVIDSCVVDGFAVGYDADNVTYNGMAGNQITRCEFKNCVYDGIRSGSGLTIDHNWIHDNGVNGILSVSSGGSNSWCVSNNVITGNTGRGFYNTTAPTAATSIWYFVNNTIAHNGAPGVEFSSSLGDANLYFCDNVFYGNTTAAIKTNGTWGQVWLTNNAYEAGSLSSVNAGPSDVTLTAEPRVSSTDYGLNATAGGGAACKLAAAAPPNASANTPGDIGAVPSGGGGVVASVGPVGQITGARSIGTY